MINKKHNFNKENYNNYLDTRGWMNYGYGWACPKCGHVYSPTVFVCYYCGNESYTTSGSNDENVILG